MGVRRCMAASYRCAADAVQQVRLCLRRTKEAALLPCNVLA